MLSKKPLRYGFVFFSLVLLSMYALEIDADARIGRGGSFGSRGTRSYSAPRTPSPSTPSSPSRQYNSPAPTPASPTGGGFLRGMGGGIMGGMLGGMLFRGLGFGSPGGMGGGGIGLFEIILVGLILYGIWWFIKKKRREESPLGPSLYSNTSFPAAGTASYAPAYAPPAEERDVETGLGHIMRMDPGFQEQPFKDQCLDAFFKVQGGWANRDMSTVRNLLTDEIYRITQADAEELKKNQHLNRLDNIAVRTVEITEAWQEAGKDYITVRFYANLLDYTVDEKTGQVISGSKTEPIKFEEYWTFTRPVGNGPWQLSAISQGQ